MIHQKESKRMLLKIPNFGQNKRENGGVRESSVWFGGGGTGLRSAIPKPQHHFKSFPEISFPGDHFLTCLVRVAEFARAS